MKIKKKTANRGSKVRFKTGRVPIPFGMQVMCLRALCHFADRPSIVTTTGELSTMEQRFECDLKLSGLKADAWPDVEEKNVRLKECLKAGRTCIAVRSALDCVLLADKDHQR